MNEILKTLESLCKSGIKEKSAFRIIRKRIVQEDTLSKKFPAASRKQRKQRGDSTESKASFFLLHREFIKQYSGRKLTSKNI